MGTSHPDPVASTWALSFERIEKANAAAAELLRFCAFLHPDAIPEEVFHQGAPELGPLLAPMASNALMWNEAVSEILKYSLLRRDPEAGTRLVQAVLKQGMDEVTQRLRAERFVRAVNRAFPFPEFSTWVFCERLLPQTHACAELINQWGFEFPEAARLLNQAGLYLFERGRYPDAEPLYQRALAIWERALGPEHPNVALNLNLALLYHAQGRYAKAEPLYKRALVIEKKALGPEHPNVAQSLNNLAELYHAQGRYAEAEPLYQHALAIGEKVLGPEHPNVAQSLNNLAELYHAQGRYAEAEPLYKHALAIGEKALGPEHPNVAQSLNNLAELYRAQGRYAEAEPLYKHALAIGEKALGPEHPDVATSLKNYAGLLHDMGRTEEAASLESRARTIRANRTTIVP
jgi:tetratricopeptide (TPR) repeat protein